MLFIAKSHKLSPYIFELDERTLKLSSKERAKIKEQIKSDARYVILSLVYFLKKKYLFQQLSMLLGTMI